MYMQVPIRRIIRSAVLFLFIYCGLLLLFKNIGLADAYGHIFRKVGATMYSGSWGDKSISIKKHKRKKNDPPRVNTIILVRKKGEKAIKGSLIDTWVFACLSNVVLLSLICITPVNWMRKGKIFIAAFLVLNIILILKLGLNILAIIAESNWFQMNGLNNVLNSILPFIRLIEQHSIFAMLLGFLSWLYFSIDYLILAIKKDFELK